MSQALDKLSTAERKILLWARRDRELKGTLGLLLEGEKLTVEALKSNIKSELCWVTENFVYANESLIARIEKTGCPISNVSTRVMEALSGMDTPPGIIMAAHQPLIRLCSPNEKWKFIVVLFGAQDPGNVGGVLRTAEYFGVDEVWLGSGSVDPYSPKVIRGSMGAALRLPIFRGDVPERIKIFRSSGSVVWGSVAHGYAEPVINPAPKRILLIGQESSGLTERELALADKRVRIPKPGRGESLNLGVATGILIYSALGSLEKA